jgi:hypothetical protein
MINSITSVKPHLSVALAVVAVLVGRQPAAAQLGTVALRAVAGTCVGGAELNVSLAVTDFMRDDVLAVQPCLCGTTRLPVGSVSMPRMGADSTPRREK